MNLMLGHMDVNENYKIGTLINISLKTRGVPNIEHYCSMLGTPLVFKEIFINVPIL